MNNRSSTRSKTHHIKPEKSTTTTLFEYLPKESTQDSNRRSITFTRHDYKQLQARHFFNDTIIHLFLQYHLDNTVDSRIKQRTHVFSSFLFAKIKSIHSRKSECPPSYSFTKRWLKDVCIFEKDFLIMPVCDRDHWILLIVCYLYNQPSKDTHKIPDDDLHEPAVIVLNSCKGLAPPIKKALSQFLTYQWYQERGQQRSFSINGSKSNGIRLIFPDLPQQKNNHDCGVYILGYFHLFLNNPRSAYIRMFRRQGMQKWFSENNLDISRERRKMISIVKSLISQWTGNGEEISTSSDILESDSNDVHVVSMESNSPDCVEETYIVEHSSEAADFVTNDIAKSGRRSTLRSRLVKLPRATQFAEIRIS